MTKRSQRPSRDHPSSSIGPFVVADGVIVAADAVDLPPVDDDRPPVL